MLESKKIDQASRMAARWLAKSCQVTDSAETSLGAFATGYEGGTGGFVYGPLVWHSSVAIRALLKIHGRTKNPAWKEAAILGGRYLESVQAVGDGGEDSGSLWGPWLGGNEPLVVDVNYRSMGGLLDLYGATGSPHYLESSRRIADWFIDRAYKGGGTHLNRYFPDRKVLGWPRSHIVDEGSIIRLQDLTREESYSDLCRDQVEELSSSLREDGWFSCMETPRMERHPEAGPDETSPRDVYWHLSPLLMAYSKKGRKDLLQPIEAAGRMMLGLQSPEGSLESFYSKSGTGRGGSDGVSTSMFVSIWLRLWEITENGEYLEGAERGLAWIISSQLTARRAEAFGAFSDGPGNRGGTGSSLGSAASSFGIIAAEEYFRVINRTG
jgi:hypothetical protein